MPDAPVSRLDAHTAWFEGRAGGERLTFVGDDLRAADLSGRRMIEAVWAHVDARGANLESVALLRAELADVNLDAGRLVRARLSDARAERVSFVGAAMDGVELDGVTAKACVFDEAVARRAVLTKAEFYRCSLRGARLTDGVMRRAEFHDSDLAGATLAGADLSYGKLYNSDLRGANLQGVALSYARLHSTRLAGATGVPAVADGVRAQVLTASGRWIEVEADDFLAGLAQGIWQ